MVTQGYTATLVAATSGHQPVESVLPEEAARQPGRSTRTTSRSSWRAGKNPRTDIAAWLGGCDEKKTFR